MKSCEFTYNMKDVVRWSIHVAKNMRSEQRDMHNTSHKHDGQTPIEWDRARRWDVHAERRKGNYLDRF